ncbi:hypothetical protein CapIbe_023319 [Capra ibex]
MYVLMFLVGTTDFIIIVFGFWAFEVSEIWWLVTGPHEKKCGSLCSLTVTGATVPIQASVLGLQPSLNGQGGPLQ